MADEPQRHPGSSELLLSSLPETFTQSLTREFISYSVNIARIVEGKAATFTPLGTGTLVRRGTKHGILTAHHCLHSMRPQVSLGPDGTDTLLLFLRGGNAVRLHAADLFEHPLAGPPNDDYGPWGPDLTFIEIIPSKVGAISAYGSWWPLDKSAEEIASHFGQTGRLLVFAGFPEEKCGTEISVREIYRHAHLESGVSVIEQGDIEEWERWDYITTTLDYSYAPEMPKDFGGYSGGAIWAMELATAGRVSEIHIARSALVGVIFYQLPRELDCRRIRGHFIKSIYTEAWL